MWLMSSMYSLDILTIMIKTPNELILVLIEESLISCKFYIYKFYIFSSNPSKIRPNTVQNVKLKMRVLHDIHIFFSDNKRRDIALRVWSSQFPQVKHKSECKTRVLHKKNTDLELKQEQACFRSHFGSHGPKACAKSDVHSLA